LQAATEGKTLHDRGMARREDIIEMDLKEIRCKDLD
jgi:hypothetical protein